MNFQADKIYCGDAFETLKTFPDESVNCCITSPPYYGLRDYGVDGQIGNETTTEEYIYNLIKVFDEIKRILKKDGTLWLNIGDSYAGSNQGKGAKNPSRLQFANRGTQYMFTQSVSRLAHVKGCKPKDLIGIPWMLAFALRGSGWYLRQDIIWAKGNPMPESVKDRCTKSHEYIFLLSKSKRYYFDNSAMREPAVSLNDLSRRLQSGHALWTNNKAKDTYAVSGKNRSRTELYSKDGMRNKRDVWFVNTKKYSGAHFATYPDTLIEPCILAGCPKGGIVLDPFIGSGTTAVVAARHNRHYIGIELNPNYVKIANTRIEDSLSV
ncbi:MAG: site-specific DNA-methyltransferase [Clostridia bacterium]|nr:site-specific DNA-methyltransferase [Clostridia bacterium]